MDDRDCCECAVDCCSACCVGVCEACLDSDDLPLSCCCCCVLAGLAALALAAVLVAAFASVSPVRVSVNEASIGRLALVAAPATNVTGAAAAEPSLSYDISLGIALRNPNWAMGAWLVGLLDAELRFCSSLFARARLLASGAESDRIRPRRREVYRVAAAVESAPMALGSGGAVEFAREHAAGVFEVEVVVSGEAKYQAHLHGHSFRASCPLKLSLATTTASAALARVECT